MNTSQTDHFEGKNAYEHILQKKSEIASEVHGEELPGHWGAFLDASRDMSMLLLVVGSIAHALIMPTKQTQLLLVLLGLIWIGWKCIRSTWFSASLLERLHRVLKEESYEIKHNREQEKEELTALYASKGLQGELLEDVIHVLMADDERLLKVMMEEEMGLNLEHYEHPLKIGAGAALGASFTLAMILSLQWAWPFYGLLAGAFFVKSFSGMWMAKMQKNDLLSAFVWNLGAAILLYGMSYFLTQWIQPLLN